MADRLRVCMILEGSYPYITGGVSAWVQDLILGLPEIEFSLFTLSPKADQEMRYRLPENVKEHKDIVIWKEYESAAHPKNRKGIFAALEQFHNSLMSGSDTALLTLLEQFPEGYYFHRNAVENNIGWNMLTRMNSLKNPLYPFSDYFWAWKSAHTMLFNSIGASPPEADIYHAVSTGFAGIVGLAAKARRKKPFFLTEHGLYHKEREMEIRKAKFVRGYQRDMWIHLYNNLSRLSYRHADRITALFEENRQKQLELGAEERKAFVVPNGIDVDRFSVPRTPRSTGFHIGLVGRVVPIKDIKTYIAMAKIVSEAIPEAVFYCIGPTDEDPAYYEDCKLLVRNLKLDQCFLFTGRQNVLEYYSFLDVVVLTSIREAQPLVILEAYCAGIPFVATRVGNVAEMLDYDDRFIAPLKDAEKLAKGILYIHDHPEEITGMVKNNQYKVRHFYNKTDLMIKFLFHYQELAGAEQTAVSMTRRE